jgi:hypothetical protein
MDTQSALRLVFSQDSDFKERMFARQLAVMKGQAWNVVETLKTSDHGPLELTRRARVYVWDDVVEIPVAVPLRTPSAETRRRRQDEEGLHRVMSNEEMDISAANASSSDAQHDPLGLGLAAEFPSSSRFVVPHLNGGAGSKRPEDDSWTHRSPSSPVTIDGLMLEEEDAVEGFHSRLESSEPSLPAIAKWRATATAAHASPQAQNPAATTKRRRSSGTNRSATIGLLHDDDLEGDLGYAAAEGMEKNQRKVIVERLENVKSKNPVFTWC